MMIRTYTPMRQARGVMLQFDFIFSSHPRDSYLVLVEQNELRGALLRSIKQIRIA